MVVRVREVVSDMLIDLGKRMMCVGLSLWVKLGWDLIVILGLGYLSQGSYRMVMGIGIVVGLVRDDDPEVNGLRL